METSQEIRSWIQFIFLVIGGIIAIRTYQSNQEQRKLENSFRLINLFKESLQESDLENWIKIFHASSETAGAQHGHFIQMINNRRNQTPFSRLFSEGSPDNGAIGRIAELCDLISHEALNKTIDIRLVYFQLGQLMDTTHSWLLTINKNSKNDNLINRFYPYFNRLYKQNLIKKNWSRRTYAHIE